MLYILSAMDLQHNTDQEATYTYLLYKFLSMDLERLPGIFSMLVIAREHQMGLVVR